MNLSATVLIASLWIASPGSESGSATEAGAKETAAADPTILVARLGSPRFRERQRAFLQLETLGPVALPALRAAKTTRDPEIQSRARELLDRIERVLMLRPTLAVLNERNRHLNEVLDSLGSQTRVKIHLDGRDFFRVWPRITIVEPKPLPFWDALDLVCRAGRVRRSILSPQSMGDGGLFSESDGLLTLNELGQDKVHFPSYNHGPFQIRLIKFRLDRELVLDRKDGEPTDRFQAILAVAAEPRLAIGLDGSPRTIKAIDDRGRSLKIEPPAKEEGSDDDEIAPGIPVDAIHETTGDQTVSIPLRMPKGGIGAIALFQGTVPLWAAGLRDDPLSIPLDDAIGKTYRDGGLSVIVQNVKKEADGASIDLVIRDDFETIEPDGRQVDFWSQTLLRRLILVDAKNRRVSWMPDNFDGFSGTHQVSLKTLPGLGRGSPVRLLVHGLIRAKTDVPFEFRDLRGIP